jgi:6,7-dimethyl-8-ribityllumazine synthase
MATAKNKRAALPKKTAKTGYAAPEKPAKNEFKGARVALVVTRWNVGIVDALLAGARRCLADWGVNPKHVAEFRAPGAFELPLAVSALMKSGEYDAVVTLGAVIRGDTPHFDFVAGECSRGLREASQKHGVALGFGVLTVNTDAQAVERSGPGSDNKGYEATAAALEMLRFLRALDE